MLRIVFLLPFRPGGGGVHSVVQEANAMRLLGVNVRVAIRKHHRSLYSKMYGQDLAYSDLFAPYTWEMTLKGLVAGSDIVIATHNITVCLAERILKRHPHVMPAYYIQDYEPSFYQHGSRQWSVAVKSYTHISNMILFAKTDWICSTVARRHGATVHKVRPSLDHSIYAPPQVSNRGATQIVISAMVRPKTPYRGASRTMRILKRLKSVYGNKVRVDIFGATTSALASHGLVGEFEYRNHGLLRREEVAAVLQSSDIFLDLSDYQAFGRTGLEAMACRCATVLPICGGAHEYACHGQNSVLVETQDEQQVFKAVANLIDDHHSRERLQVNGLITAKAYDMRSAAESELQVLRMGLECWRQPWSSTSDSLN